MLTLFTPLGSILPSSSHRAGDSWCIGMWDQKYGFARLIIFLLFPLVHFLGAGESYERSTVGV